MISSYMYNRSKDNKNNNKTQLQLMINIQPNLIGKLVNIRPLFPSDFQSYYKIGSDPLIWQQHPEPQRYQRDFFKMRMFDQGINCKGGLVVENKVGEVIGGSRYYNYRADRKDIMIGYTFLPRHLWGLKQNHQIKHLMLMHVYQWVDTVYFSVGINNTRSCKAMCKVRGVLLTPQQQIQNQVIVPGSVIYRIKKQNFKGII